MSGAARYREAGVDLDAADAAQERIMQALASARGPLALGRIGAFGGMVRVPDDVPDPVLVLSTDSVGTKVLVAIRAGVHDTVGEDLVNHSVNDILVHGARPIAFQDYIAAATLVTETIAQLVEGVARGCRAHNMMLAGGETAQLPDLYHEGHYDLAGTVLGIVRRDKALHGDRARPGDILVGYAASGLHTNGYTLARRIVFGELGLDIDTHVEAIGATVGAALLAVHRSYWVAIAPALDRVQGLAHITGGGIPGNLVRSLPDGCGAVVEAGAWEVPPLFRWLVEAGRVEFAERYRVFNMGIGMIAAVRPGDVDAVRQAAGVLPTFVIGEVTSGAGVRVAP